MIRLCSAETSIPRLSHPMMLTDSWTMLLFASDYAIRCLRTVHRWRMFKHTVCTSSIAGAKVKPRVTYWTCLAQFEWDILPLVCRRNAPRICSVILDHTVSSYVDHDTVIYNSLTIRADVYTHYIHIDIEVPMYLFSTVLCWLPVKWN